MRPTITILFLLFFPAINAQEIFEFERKISDEENYYKQELTFQSAEMDRKKGITEISLFGTLIEPINKDFNKVVLIVPGTGLYTRHNHYLLTENLLKNNIAVFRYDERGVNKSEGKNSTAFYGITEITNDVVAALKALKTHYNGRDVQIGLIGHSRGGMCAINAVKQFSGIDFLVQWAVPVEKHAEFLKYQIKTGINTFDNELKFDTTDEKIQIIEVIQEVVSNNLNDDNLSLRKKLDKATKKYGYKRQNYDRFRFYTFPSRKDLLRQNNELTYKSLDKPMLYIIGENDKFVDPISNTKLLESLNNENIETIILKGLNHYLTEEEVIPNNVKMSSSFYEIDSEALEIIIDWIKKY